MRILVVTNLYPPHYYGGYEVRCAQVAEALQAAGHDVCVLTSAHGLPLSPLSNIRRRTEERNGVPVHRWLNQYAYQPQPGHRPWTLFQAHRELADVRAFAKLAASFRPDIVSWWSMYGLSKAFLPLPSTWGIPDVHWIEQWWMIEDYGRGRLDPSVFWARVWDGEWGPPPLRPLLRRVGRAMEQRHARQGFPTRSFPNRPRHVCFVSEHMRTMHQAAGLEFPASEIIHGGVPPAEFFEAVATRRREPGRLRLLYAGQITPDRGLHTVIEAFGRLDSQVRSHVSLSVVGTGPSDYIERIKGRVRELRLGDRVTFRGKVVHNLMAGVYKEHDVLVFPSIRDEGLPLTMVEAMLGGCAVVTTGSGGAMEVATAASLPLFPKEDSVALSGLLDRLVTHPDEVARIAAHGQEVALRDFSFDRMMERWSTTLHRLHESTLRERAGRRTDVRSIPASATM
jgi:glycogen(starch) synthase